jgi:hypothetical protein
MAGLEYAEEKKTLLHRAADLVDANPEAVQVDLVHSVDGLDMHFKFGRAANRNDPQREARYRDLMYAASALMTGGH